MQEKGVNQDNVQQMNRTLIIRLLRKKGSCSRAELARLTKLQPATITNIVNEFQQLGLVKESGTIKEGRGRNAIRVTLNASEYSIISIRLSRKYFYIGTFDLNGREQSSVCCPISGRDTQKKVLADIKAGVGKAINQVKKGQVIAIGCAVPGPFLRGGGRVALMTGFPDWKNVSINEELEREFELPVYVEHDANVGALSYYWDLGAETDQLLLYVAAGQGIGAGIVSDGSLLIGALGAAGEIGHMSINFDGPYCECGNKGCLEKYCSSIALTKAVNRKIEEDNYSILGKGCRFEEIKEAVRKGDKLAVSEYRKACDKLAVGIINLVNILNPHIIVIGDEMASVCPDLMQESIDRIVKPRIIPDIWDNMRIMIGNENNDKILQGASILATEEILKVAIVTNKNKEKH